MAGGVLLAAGGGDASGRASAGGVLLCLLAGLSYAAYALLNQRMVAHAPASSITLAAFGVAALLAVPAAALQAGPALPGARDLAAAAYTGIVAAGIAYLLFSHALHHVTPATGVTLALGEPVVAGLLALLVLHEPLGATVAAGLAAVVAGVVGVVRAELRAAVSRSGAATPRCPPAARGRRAARSPAAAPCPRAAASWRPRR